MPTDRMTKKQKAKRDKYRETHKTYHDNLRELKEARENRRQMLKKKKILDLEDIKHYSKLNKRKLF